MLFFLNIRTMFRWQLAPCTSGAGWQSMEHTRVCVCVSFHDCGGQKRLWLTGVQFPSAMAVSRVQARCLHICGIAYLHTAHDDIKQCIFMCLGYIKFECRTKRNECTAIIPDQVGCHMNQRTKFGIYVTRKLFLLIFPIWLFMLGLLQRLMSIGDRLSPGWNSNSII